MLLDNNEPHTEKTLVKNFAFRNLKTVGKADWKHEELKERVFRQVLVEMNNERCVAIIYWVSCVTRACNALWASV